MDTIDFINQVASGDSAAAKETINDIISKAAFEALDLKRKKLQVQFLLQMNQRLKINENFTRNTGWY